MTGGNHTECFSLDGARRLKETIETYWRERGFYVSVNLVEQGFASLVRSRRVDVRSDMINGVPRKRL